MTPHEALHPLLALSAAGLLEPSEERRVREHIRDCPECAGRLDAFAELTAVLHALPLPPAPDGLAARTQARIAAELAESADRRQAAFLCAGSAVMAWALAVTIGYCYRLFAGGSLLWWVMWSTIPAFMAAGVLAGMLRRRQLEGILS